MKHVFLIGDSIRIGYDRYVREQLEGTAEVYWPQDNARFTQYTLRFVHQWAREECDPEKIDIVHWNNGLWDVIHILGDDAQTSIEEYVHYLERILKRIRQIFPNAKVIFALTTSVVEEYMGTDAYRRNEEICAYNAAAMEMMRREGVEIDDLYTVSAQMPTEYRTSEGTHFTEEGYKLLGVKAAECVRQLL